MVVDKQVISKNRRSDPELFRNIPKQVSTKEILVQCLSMRLNFLNADATMVQPTFKFKFISQITAIILVNLSTKLV